MNHLAHFHLSAPHPDLIVGSVLGDYVKGRLTGERPVNLDLGIMLHRAIDGYTDRHDVVRQSWRRFDQRFRRFAPLITDIIFDYFLANEWHAFHTVSLSRFQDEVFGIINDNRSQLPADAQRWSDRMERSGALASYVEPAFVHRSFIHLSGRLSRSNPLTEAFGQFETHREALRADFRQFYPELVHFVNEWKQTHAHFLD